MPSNSEYVFNVTTHYQTYKNFIRTQSDIRLNEYYKANQLSTSGEATSSVPRKQNVENYDERVKTLNEELQLLNHPDAIDQKRAYQKAIAHLTGENPDQLRMFLSGEGGTGKSKVLKLIIEFTRLHFGRTEGHHGAVIPMGPTGPSAHNINGFTYHTIAALGSGSSAGPNIGQKTAEQKGQGMKGVQLFIIDEISLVSKQDLAILEQRIKACILTTIEDPIERDQRKNQPFAGIHFIFAGDFYQLPPVFNKIPIYSPHFSEHAKDSRTKKLQQDGSELWNSLNAYCELKVNFRTKSDDIETKQLAEALSRLRLGQVLDDDLDLLNTRILFSHREALSKVSKDALFLCPTKEMVRAKNKDALQHFIISGAEHFRCVAVHKQNETLKRPPTTTINKALLKHYEDKLSLPFIDLAIGSRVRCTVNLATNIGV